MHVALICTAAAVSLSASATAVHCVHASYGIPALVYVASKAQITSMHRGKFTALIPQCLLSTPVSP